MHGPWNLFPTVGQEDTWADELGDEDDPTRKDFTYQAPGLSEPNDFSLKNNGDS